MIFGWYLQKCWYDAPAADEGYSYDGDANYGDDKTKMMTMKYGDGSSVSLTIGFSDDDAMLLNANLDDANFYSAAAIVVVVHTMNRVHLNAKNLMMKALATIFGCYYHHYHFHMMIGDYYHYYSTSDDVNYSDETISASRIYSNFVMPMKMWLMRTLELILAYLQSGLTMMELKKSTNPLERIRYCYYCYYPLFF